MFSDQTNFDSKLIAKLLYLAGVAKSHTTAYHPMGNGELSVLIAPCAVCCGLFPLAQNIDGQSRYRPSFAYNATIHETTG